jgi:hypothetical protein
MFGLRLRDVLKRPLDRRVVFVSTISGFFGSEAFFRLLQYESDLQWPLKINAWANLVSFNLHTPFADVFFIPFSILTWLILAQYLRNGSRWRAIVIGLLSPLVGVALWGGTIALIALPFSVAEGSLSLAGLLEPLAWAIRFYYYLAPFGVATSLVIFCSTRESLPKTAS